MIIYNVTTKVTWPIHEAWVTWMKQEHIPDIMNTGLFHDFRMCRLLEQEDSEGPTYAIQYYTDGLENYNTYIQEHSSLLLQRALSAFGDQFISFRTVMEVV